MNSTGIFSLVLVLFFIILSMKAFLVQKEFFTQAKETTKVLMEMEKASFVRNELETNFDFLIKHSIEVWATKGLDSKFLKGKINKEIAKFVSKTKSIHKNNVSFFLLQKENGKKQKFSEEKMKEFFNIRIKLIENLFEAEFSFNGGVEKNIIFGSSIESNNFSKKFFISPGYERKFFVKSKE